MTMTMTDEQVCRVKKSLLKRAVEVENVSELKQQIEKMKCCENCKYRHKLKEMEILGLDREPCNVCNNHDKWEIYG